MRNPDNVLIGIALFLLAGVVVFNVLSAPKPEEPAPEAITVTVTVTESEPTSSSSPVSDGKLDINTATAAQFETLSGIGPAKAQAIVDYRTEHGNFKSVNDLLKVSGIGEKTLAKFIDDIKCN